MPKIPIPSETQAGNGNWSAFPPSRIPEIFSAAEDWKRQLAGIEKPWLCWCVSDDWCLWQQRLVAACGWTPVVGTDGRVEKPTLHPGAAFVDFNSTLKLPVMWMHFPLEFAFLFSDKLAFWHSDVLPPVTVMKQLADEFATVQPGEFLGVLDAPGPWSVLRRFTRGVRRRSWKWISNSFSKRYFEVLGCTTAEASRSQYECGCGFWRHIELHPNASPRQRNSLPHYEHGVGVYHWHKYYGGRTRNLTIDIDPFHYVTKTRSRDARGAFLKGQDLSENHQLSEICKTLGLATTTC